MGCGESKEKAARQSDAARAESGTPECTTATAAPSTTDKRAATGVVCDGERHSSESAVPAMPSHDRLRSRSDEWPATPPGDRTLTPLRGGDAGTTTTAAAAAAATVDECCAPGTPLALTCGGDPAGSARGSQGRGAAEEAHSASIVACMPAASTVAVPAEVHRSGDGATEPLSAPGDAVPLQAWRSLSNSTATDAAPALHDTQLPLPPLRSLGSDGRTCEPRRATSAAPVHEAEGSCAWVARDLRWTGRMGESSSALMGTLGDTVVSTQPPSPQASRSSSCPPCALLSREPSAAAGPQPPSPPPASATPAAGAAGHHLPRSPSRHRGGGRPVEGGARTAELRTRHPTPLHSLPTPRSLREVDGAASPPTAAIAQPLCIPGESPTRSISGGRGGGASGGKSPATLSTQPPSAVPAARRSRSGSSPPLLSPRAPLPLLAEAQSSPRTPGRGATVSAHVTVPASGSAPDDVPLPQLPELFSAPYSSCACSTRGSITHGSGESALVALVAVPGNSPHAVRLYAGHSGAYQHTTQSSSWLMASMNSTDGAGGGGGGGVAAGGSAPSTPPTNSELVRQIRQPATHVKSILRRPGSAAAGASTMYGAVAASESDAANASHSRVLSLSTSGAAGGGTETNTTSTPRLLVGSGTMGLGADGRGSVSVPSSSLPDGAVRTDFIVLRSGGSDLDVANSAATPAEASPSPLTTRSPMYRGSPIAAWLQASGQAGAGSGTPPTAAGHRPLGHSQPRQRSPSMPMLLSPLAARQRPSAAASAPMLLSAAATEPSSLFLPETVAASARTSDEPPPDIQLVSPPPKRVHLAV
ncbi:hypothetical protein NESM_000431200 [Novymonas esmeraldas]|uniref:Uncharacterized protein n=1 Tax=Novymonas esmeraldas TaxID=1808958 RepID=A0AAW0ENF8_9TRYP